MDPVTAALNAYSATLTLVTHIIDRASTESISEMIENHEMRLNILWRVIVSWPGPLKDAAAAIAAEQKAAAK